MRTIATGFFNGQAVRITSVWFNARTGSSYCEFYYGAEGYTDGLRTQLDNVKLLQFIVGGVQS